MIQVRDSIPPLRYSNYFFPFLFFFSLLRIDYSCLTLEFEKLNPVRYVPALVDGDFVLADSFAIILVRLKLIPLPCLISCQVWLIFIPNLIFLLVL